MADESEQDDCEPQFTGTILSSTCSLLPQDLLMTGLIRNVLMHHFSSSRYLENPDLRHLIWKDADDTGIMIEAAHRWTPTLTEKRPGLIVKRNDVENLRLGIGDRHQGPAADIYGHPHYETFWVGSHTVFCIGASGSQAEILGTEAQRELTEFGPVIQESVGGLKRFNVLKRGAVGRLEEARENFVVPVTVGYCYEERWTVRQQAPPLRAISLSLLSEC